MVTLKPVMQQWVSMSDSELCEGMCGSVSVVYVYNDGASEFSFFCI